MSWSPSFFRACKNNKTNSEIEVIDKLDKRILLPPPHPSNGLGFSCFLNYYFFFFYMLVKVYRISLPAPPTPPPPHPFFKNDVTCLYCVVNFMAVVVQVSDVAYGPRVLFIQFWWILFLLFLTFFCRWQSKKKLFRSRLFINSFIFIFDKCTWFISVHVY